MILDHLARAPFEDGPPYKDAGEFLELARYGQVYLKITPFNVTPKSWGKATPDTFFAKLIDTFGASRIAWGSNFPNSPGTVSEILARGAAGVLIRQSFGSGLDFWQDRAGALPDLAG